jgi:cytochrome c biogenesis protein
VLIQELPFTINLKKFTIDFYSTGMPKLFASDVEVRDNQTGETAKATIEVNKPLIFKGVAIYQSSFEDGGSKLKLTGYPWRARHQRFDIAGEVGTSTPLGDAYTVEWSGFRPFNVENIGPTDDPRAVKQGRRACRS